MSSKKSAMPRSEEIRESIKFFLANVSIHGLSNLRRTSRPILKILWAIVILALACYCFLNIMKSINDYFEYKRVIMSKITHNLPSVLPLPVITFCNLDRNLTIDDMLLKCSYGDDKCTSLDFYKMPNKLAEVYGNISCYSFNIGKNSYGNQTKIKRANYKTLQLDMFIGNSETTDNTELGLNVMIHDQKHYNNLGSGRTEGKFIIYDFNFIFKSKAHFILFQDLKFLVVIFFIN